MKVIFTLAAISILSIQVDLPKKLRKAYIFVPSGNVEINDEKLAISSFYMAKAEVTNGQYNAFLDWLSENGTEEEQMLARIRNENWIERYQTPGEKYAEYYHIHEAYQDYPAVNVTYEGAMLYCNWLQTQLNEELDDQSVVVRLPSHAEFISAGAGESAKSSYAWGDNYLREPDGNFRANCLIVLQQQITRDEGGYPKIVQPIRIDGAHQGSVDLTAPSESYYPYSHGFYNLNGNVAEMISEKGVAVGGSFQDYGRDIRLQSRKAYEGSACDVGFRPVILRGEEQ
jgi:formylglycine-generating enzyme required for sulfatase activity